MLDKVGIKAKVKLIEVGAGRGARKATIRPTSGRMRSGPDPLAALKCFHSQTPRTACNYVGFKNPSLRQARR